MTITITPQTLSGTVTPPPSKSQAHRLLIAAALARGESVIENVAYSKDIEATIRCLEELGAEFECVGGGAFAAPGAKTVRVTGMGANTMSPMRRMAYPHLDCGESGSTLRFLIPIALAVRGGGIFHGSGRLMERPLQPYFDLFDEKGISYEQKDGVLTVSGLLTPGVYELPGNVSSQFFTGLLFALPLLDGPSAVIPTTPLESEGYIHMTLQAMAQFGVMMPATMSLPPQYHPQGNQIYTAANAAVEADWSQAAFWYAAQALGNPVTVEGMDPCSTQGDREFLDWVRMVKNEPMTGGFTATVPIWGSAPEEAPPVRPSGGCAVSIDVSQNPDLVPPLAVMGALMNGRLDIKNAARLRMKESDRLASVTAVLTALGADVEEGPDSLTIRGKQRLPGGVTVETYNDHRIAMMAAIAATRCEKPVDIAGAECVSKSYPDFWEEYERLGGKVIRT